MKWLILYSILAFVLYSVWKSKTAKPELQGAPEFLPDHLQVAALTNKAVIDMQTVKPGTPILNKGRLTFVQ